MSLGKISGENLEIKKWANASACRLSLCVEN
jgi:hypothetical protein